MTQTPEDLRTRARETLANEVLDSVYYAMFDSSRSNHVRAAILTVLDRHLTRWAQAERELKDEREKWAKLRAFVRRNVRGAADVLREMSKLDAEAGETNGPETR